MGRVAAPHIITDDSALGGSVIKRALRFNDDDNAYLNRTPSSASNRRTWTFSVWLKRGNLGGEQRIFSGYNGSNATYQCGIKFFDNNTFQVFNSPSGSLSTNLITNKFFRDTSSWYHIVVAVDMTQGTAANRVKIYINGEQETSFSTANYGSQNEDFWFNNTTLHSIGRMGSSGTQYFDGYMAEVNFIDGYAYDSSYFGYTESQTGLWRPKKYEGAYGTNGFHLEFKDNSSTSALGKDTSGNGNDFTTNNFSVSAGTGNDSLEDTPTNNFPTWHPLYTYYQSGGTAAYSDGNLKLNTTANTGGAGTYYPFGFATFGARSGKWYAEFKCDTNHVATGVANTGQLDSDVSSNPYGAYANTSIIYTSRGKVRSNNSNLLSSVPTYASGDIIGVALDLDNNKIYFHKNGSYINSGNPNTASNGITLGSLPSGRTGDFVFSCGSDGVQSIGVYANFGQRAFNYTLPTGYKSMCVKNLPAQNVPSIIRPQKHFETLLWTGNGGTSQTVTGLNFKPDFVWVKGRNSAWHRLQNSVVGANKLLYSNSTSAEATDEANGYVSEFTSSGFQLADPGGNGGGVNLNGDGYVAWSWKGGGAAVSNSDGTITSQVSANTEAGFSIITYTGTGADGTIGHGLGKTPSWVITKKRSGTQNWLVKHSGAGSGKVAYLDLADPPDSTGSGGGIISDFSSSSTYTVTRNNSGSDNYGNVNASGQTYVAYCWAEIPGYSKFGQYYGNGSTDGTYVHLGFRPAWLMIKRLDSSAYWVIHDSKRDPINPNDEDLYANIHDSATTTLRHDFLSNGFKLRTSTVYVNANGGNYIYMAFAEQPGTTPYDTQTNAR